MQGYLVKFDLSKEEYVEFPKDLVLSQKRRRLRYITRLTDFSELHLTSNNQEEYIEIEYDYKITKMEQLFLPIKILFDLIYVESLSLLDFQQMTLPIDEANKILLYLKNIKQMKITSKDNQNKENHQLINFEDKPVSLPVDKVLEINQTGKYFVTNKLNGVRFFMLIYGGFAYLVSRGGAGRKGGLANIWLFEDLRGSAVGRMGQVYLLDGEYWGGKFWIFDVLLFENKPLVNNPYWERVYILSQFSKTFSSPRIILKVIYKVNVASGISDAVEYCKQTFGSRWKLDNDGFIFNHMDATYIDKNFKTYKWKFPSQQTIDVKVGGLIEGKPSYTYDISVKDKSGLISVNKLYRQEGLYNPIPLTPSIVEVKWVKGMYPFNFIKSRSRPDKVDPNYIDTANSVWEDIQNPISLSSLERGVLDVGDKNMEWVEYRKYSNYRKNKLITENIKSNSTILDIGFGKGGDIKKYKGVGVKLIYAFEPDIENIKEFFRRYNLGEALSEKRVYNLYVENINIVLFHMDALSLKDPIIRSMIVSPIDTVCLFFSLTYFFGNDYGFVDLFNSISYLKGNFNIIGAVMDGYLAKKMLTTYVWDPRKCGLDMKLNGRQIYIFIEGSETVRGHTEYLVELNRLENYLKLYGYECKFDRYNYNKSPANLVSQFANLNTTFVFNPRQIPQLNKVLLTQSIVYNERLGLDKDSTYFIDCQDSIIKIPNQLDGLLGGKPIKKSKIIVLDGKYFFVSPKADTVSRYELKTKIQDGDVDKYRNYLLTGKYKKFTLIEKVSLNQNERIEKYGITLPVLFTNIVLNTLSTNIIQICDIIKENVCMMKNLDIYELSPGVGIFTIYFSSMFRSVKCLVGDNIHLFNHNISLLDTKDNIKIVTPQEVENVRGGVIFIDKFLFDDEFTVGNLYNNIVVVRVSPDKLTTSSGIY